MISDKLKTEHPSLRASLKGQEIAKIGPQARQRVQFGGADYDIEIVSLNAISGGVEVFARAWKGGEQVGFGKDGTVDIERFRFINPPILVDDPTGDIVFEWVDEITGANTRKLREDPEEAIKQALVGTIKTVGKKGNNIVQGKVGNTTTTVFATEDGRVLRTGTNLTWADLRDGAGTSTSTGATFTPATLQHGSVTDRFSGMARGIYVFDTSSIGDTDTIDSATFSLYGFAEADASGLNMSMNVFNATPADEGNIVAGDYTQLGTTAFSDTPIAISAYTLEAYNDFAFNATGEAAIDKTGNTPIGTRNNFDSSNVAPTWSDSAFDFFNAYGMAETGTTKDPKLVVEHTGAAVTQNHSTLLMMGVG